MRKTNKDHKKLPKPLIIIGIIWLVFLVGAFAMMIEPWSMDGRIVV